MIDETVRSAVRRLLIDRGYQAMTIEQVAKCTGVAKTAIYRRWRSKAEMVFEVAVHGGSIAAPADTGSVGGDLRVLVGHVLALLSDDAVRGAMPGLIADLRADRDLGERFQRCMIDPERRVVAAILGRAKERGEISSQACPAQIHAQLLGTLFAWVYLVGEPPADDLADRVTDALVAAAGAPPNKETDP